MYCRIDSGRIIPSIHVDQADELADFLLETLFVHFPGRMNNKPDVGVEVALDL